MRHGSVLRTAIAVIAAGLLPALGTATPAWAQAANQLCGAAGLGAGCIGTPTISPRGPVGGGMGGLGGMNNALGAFSFGLGILNMMQEMQDSAAAEAPQAVPTPSMPANLGGYTTYAQPSAPPTDTFNLERNSLLDQFRSVDDSNGPAISDPSNPAIGTDPTVQAEKSTLMGEMRDLGNGDETASANAQVPFDTAGANQGNTAANQLCSAAGAQAGCIKFPKIGGGAPSGGGVGSANPANRVASTNNSFVPGAASAVNPPIDSGSDAATNPPVGAAPTDGTNNAPSGGTPIGFDSPPPSGGAPAGVTLGSGGPGGPAAGRPCNQISGYQITTGAFGTSQVQAQITPCSDGGSTLANTGPSDAIPVDLDKPVPLLRAPSETPPSVGLDRTYVPPPPPEAIPLPSGYYVGATIGESSAEWYADRYVATGYWWYLPGGWLASLWTPDTWQETLATLQFGYFLSDMYVLWQEAMLERLQMALLERQEAMLAGAPGFNVSPWSTMIGYDKIVAQGISDVRFLDTGAIDIVPRGTPLTDMQAIDDVIGPIRIGPLPERVIINPEQAAALEGKLGLDKGTLGNGGVINVVEDVAGRNPKTPFVGNAQYQRGVGLPGGGPEINVNPISTTGGPGITQIELVVTP